MISVRFLKKVFLLPYVVVRAVVQYYTVGTIYSRTNKEFQSSLYKNVHLMVEHHLANNFSREDVARFVYEPVSKLVEKYRKHPLAVGLHGYGEKINERTFWIVRAEQSGNGTGTGTGTGTETTGFQNSSDKSAVLYLHGGGYCLNVFAAQFVALLALPYSVPEPARSELSIAVVDYSLTCHYEKYPTQIFQALQSYRALVDAGYTRITLLGDSAGTNLALAVNRFIAYPEEAQKHFSEFSDFEWDFSPLVQPEHLIFVSPWLEPYSTPELIANVNTEGDLGAIDTQLGDWYVEDLDREKVAPFVHFTKTEYESHWAKVRALNGKGRTLYIYGEREILRSGVEKFVDIVTKSGDGKLEVYMEAGGIHDGLFYVESLDYLSYGGAKSALEGDFALKYGFSLVAKFLAETQ